MDKWATCHIKDQDNLSCMNMVTMPINTANPSNTVAVFKKGVHIYNYIAVYNKKSPTASRDAPPSESGQAHTSSLHIARMKVSASFGRPWPQRDRHLAFPPTVFPRGLGCCYNIALAACSLAKGTHRDRTTPTPHHTSSTNHGGSACQHARLLLKNQRQGEAAFGRPQPG